MRAPNITFAKPRRVGALALAAVLAGNLFFPSLALAVVRVDETELAQGANGVGGGTATLSGSSLEMTGVTAGDFYTDEDLDISFAGGNDISTAYVEDAMVGMSFTGENDVEDIYALGDANVTVNADGHNEFEEINAYDSSSVTVKVTGENDFESMSASDDATIAVRGTSCQKKDVINLGDGESLSYIASDRGDITLDHVTVNVKANEAIIGSIDGGALTVDTSKVACDDDGYVLLFGGKTSRIRESVIDIAGTIVGYGKLVIDHSDVKVAEPAPEHLDAFDYRIIGKDGIELLNQKNGTVLAGSSEGEDLFFVDTDGNQGRSVDLKADGEPAYNKCGDKDDSDEKSTDVPATSLAAKALPRTGDATAPLAPVAAAAVLVGIAGFAARRREQA